MADVDTSFLGENGYFPDVCALLSLVWEKKSKTLYF